MVAQYLVFAAGQVVVIAVAAQLKEDEPANHMVAVPTVPGHGPFIFAWCVFVAGQSIVLNVVYCFQQQDTQQGGTQEICCGQRAELPEDHRHKSYRKHLQLQHFILPLEPGLVLFLYFPVGYMPGPGIHAGNAAQPEAVEAHAVGGTAGVNGGGHMFVVPLVVLNEEMGIQRGEQQGFGHPLLIRFHPVPQFVAYVDTKSAAGKSHHQHAAGTFPAMQGRIGDAGEEEPEGGIL